MDELLPLFILQLLFTRVADGCSPFNMESGIPLSSTSLSSAPSTFLGASSSAHGSGSSSSAAGGSSLSSIFPTQSQPNSHRARLPVPNSVDRITLAPPMTMTGSTGPPITDPAELACFNFDLDCRWRNIEGILVDELNWYQGTGMLDQTRLQIATSTHVSPEGKYAIVATETVQLPTAKAILVSDVIECQAGNGQLRFMYWTSPEVRLKVCSKTTNRIFPDYNFCSPPIETGDPGPSFTLIPSPDNEPFQIYIVAENFVFHAANLQGGFAIIDSVEYFAEMCGNEAGKTEDTQNSKDAGIFKAHDATVEEIGVMAQSSSISADTDDFTEDPLLDISNASTPPSTPILSETFPTLAAASAFDETNSVTNGPSISFQSEVDEDKADEEKQELGLMNSPIQLAVKRRGPLPNDSANLVDAEVPVTVSNSINSDSDDSSLLPFQSSVSSDMTNPSSASANLLSNSTQLVFADACSVLICSFSRSNSCARWVLDSDWKISTKSVGNKLTGIQGDAMSLPYRNGGSFAYISGPVFENRLMTPPFKLDQNGYFVFSYHKVDKSSSLRVYAKRTDETMEDLLFDAPKVTKDSRRWFREGKTIPVGSYQYIAFEVRNLSDNNYIGVDELMIFDAKRRPICNDPS
ncbi:hypothetical protein WR25_10314 [Diploscapter pachys]|uniref:MAM domain-containing protein n=1 Tax=Diploscapter pachys TaxID=2018661 RepID=A0A2A2KYI0_9BILA|nr:hypothetical protein WR25_10314 [Diploscapter pachys]